MLVVPLDPRLNMRALTKKDISPGRESNMHTKSGIRNRRSNPSKPVAALCQLSTEDTQRLATADLSIRETRLEQRLIVHVLCESFVWCPAGPDHPSR